MYEETPRAGRLSGHREGGEPLGDARASTRESAQLRSAGRRDTMQARAVLRGGAAAGMRALAAARTTTAPAGAAIRSRAFHVSRPAFAKGGVLRARHAAYYSRVSRAAGPCGASPPARCVVRNSVACVCKGGARKGTWAPGRKIEAGSTGQARARRLRLPLLLVHCTEMDGTAGRCSAVCPGWSRSSSSTPSPAHQPTGNVRRAGGTPPHCALCPGKLWRGRRDQRVPLTTRRGFVSRVYR